MKLVDIMCHSKEVMVLENAIYVMVTVNVLGVEAMVWFIVGQLLFVDVNIVELLAGVQIVEAMALWIISDVVR